MLAMVVGCKEEKKTETIIVEKPVTIVKKAETQEMSNSEFSETVKWVNDAYYSVTIERGVDKSLPVVSDEQGNKYYDNMVTLTVSRADGSVFFSKTYKKGDFGSCLDSNTSSRGALLGMVFVRAEGDYLVFSVSVGSPDPNSDEYVPMTLKLSRMGATQLERASLDELEG